MGTTTLTAKDLLRNCHGWAPPCLPCLTEKNFSPETLESSTFKSLTSNSARNISRKPNPLNVQQRIPQYMEDMLHFQLSPMLPTFEQFVLQPLSNLQASHHCNHVPTLFSFTSLLDFSRASIPPQLHLSSPLWRHEPSVTMNPGLQMCNPTEKSYVTVVHSLLYRALPRQQVAPAITQKHRGLHFLLPPINNLTQCPEYAQAVTKCGKVPLHSYPIFSLYLCLLGFYLSTLDWNEGMQH